MRGRRQKLLRERFAAINGRPPYRTRWESDGYFPSEWRRLKKAYKVRKAAGDFS